MTPRTFAATALACAAAVSLSACNTLGLGGPTGAAAVGDVRNTLDAINSAAAQHCAGTGSIDWTPPLPPTGSLHVQCVIGPQMVPLSQLSQFLGQGGNFGGGGATVIAPSQSIPVTGAPKQ